MMSSRLRFDRIGNWSEIKLEIIEQYARAYSTILVGHAKTKFFHVYIDAFAGAGQHISKTTEEVVLGVLSMR
jgi:three-Cys-motif partner protein